ncbi:hypothetical protein [Niallia sp. FSL M8-0099]|uniref:hypothetical protein n=1 Tax=Niallia sp. FSL M8-0099 TaxID=2954519 RepID=UPI0030FCF95D
MNKLISFGRKIIQKSKHLQETALQIIKQNWSKVIQEIITFFLIGFVGIGVTLGLSFLFKPLIDVFIGAYVLILMTYFTIKLLVFVSWIFFLQERKNFKKLLKSRNQNKGSLFDTLTMTNQTDLFFFELLDDDQKGNIHDNMTEIKGKIINKLGHDIYDYHRFLGYLNLQIKNNILAKRV